MYTTAMVTASLGTATMFWLLLVFAISFDVFLAFRLWRSWRSYRELDRKYQALDVNYQALLKAAHGIRV